MEIEALESFNTWWRTGKVRDDLLASYRRHLFSHIHKYIGTRQAILIYGLRRVGKSTMLYQIINDLLASVKPNNVLYFSFDDKRYELEDVLNTYQKSVLHNTFENEAKKMYIFLDEIQKVEDWENKIKSYYDLYPNVKFILSESASIALRRGAAESLAGRIFDFILEPLSFIEFLEMYGRDVSKIRKNPDLWNRDILPLFDKYIKFGTFPELIHMDNEEIAKKYINSDVIEKILYRDLPEAFGISDIELLRMLVNIVSKSPGMLVDYAALSRDLKRDQRTIANYFEYLEFGMIVKFVFNYSGSPLTSKRKLKKVYLQTPNLAFASGENLDRILPKMLENVVMLASRAVFFYRASFEVDFVLQKGNKLIGIEVKSGSANIRQLLKLKEKFGNNIARLLLLSETDEKPAEGIEIIKIWQYCLFNG